ncbi:MAG: hypothetical protein ACK5IJ_01780 [Mangrovibacterium sp.]
MRKCIVLILLCWSWNVFAEELQQDSISYKFQLKGIGGGMGVIDFLAPTTYGSFILTSNKSEYLQHDGRVSTKNHYNNILFGRRRSSNSSDQYDNSDLILSYQYDFILNKRHALNLSQSFKKQLDISVGWAYWGAFGTDIKLGNTNNMLYYNLNNSLGFSVGLEKKLTIKGTQFYIFNETTIPFVGIYLGSEYSSSLPYFIAEKDASLWEALHIGSFGANFQIHNDLNIDFKLKAKKKRKSRIVRIRYSMDYMNLGLNNNTKHRMMHAITIGYTLNWGK